MLLVRKSFMVENASNVDFTMVVVTVSARTMYNYKQSVGTGCASDTQIKRIVKWVFCIILHVLCWRLAPNT